MSYFQTHIAALSFTKIMKYLNTSEKEYGKGIHKRSIQSRLRIIQEITYELPSWVEGKQMLCQS